MMKRSTKFTFSLFHHSHDIEPGSLRRRAVDGETPAQGRAFGDIGVTAAVNLLGAPTMTAADFQELRKSPRTILGASLKVVAPTGQYNVGRILNVGGNRWGVRAELGLILPIKPKVLLNRMKH